MALKEGVMGLIYLLNDRLKHLLFSAQGGTATYGYLQVLMSFFST